MTELAELFDPATSRRRKVVGSGSAAGARASIDTSSLETVFSGEPASLGAKPAADIAAGLADMLAELPAERTDVGIGVEQIDDVDDLRALVGPSVPVSVGMVTGIPAPGRRHRSRAGRDGIAITTAVVAIVAVLTAVVVVTTVLLTKPATSDALRALSGSEALLIDRSENLNARASVLASRRDIRLSRAEDLQRSLAAMASYGDETARLAAEAARQEYVQELEAIEIPAPAPHYRRDAIDTTSLDDVAEAMNATHARMLDLDRTEEQLVRVDEALSASDGDLEAALAAFVSTVPPAAAAIVAENPDAEQAFRDEVGRTAADVASSDPVTRAGLETWTAYIAAVAALRADQQRALDEMAAEQEAVPDDDWSVYPGPVFTPPQTEPTDPGGTAPAPTDPVDPGPTDPVDPGPVDPGPTDPVDPDPQGE